jgi:hypothetical protein
VSVPLVPVIVTL